MKRYIRKVTSLDPQTIKLGKAISERLGMSFSSLIRLLINKESLIFNMHEICIKEGKKSA